MEKQEFDNKRKNLTTTQKTHFRHFLENKTDEEVATIEGISRTTANRHITNIAEKFSIKRDRLINDSGTDGIEKKVHRRKLLELCLKHISDEVTRPHIYEESGDSRSDIDPAFMSESVVNTDHRPSTSTNSQNIPTPESIPELTTLEFIGRDHDLTNLANLRKQAKIVLIKAGAGVGKSTLAREFLQTQFKKVIRIEMGLESGNVTPAEEKVSQILRKDFDEEPSRDFGINLGILGEKLADRANPIGVLIDNLEPALDETYRFREKLRGYDALLAVLGDRDVFSFTLITSRRSLITPRARVHEYSLEGLDITAWRQYFHDCENGVDSEALLQMCVAYNGNAKVMDILHGAIKNRFDGNIAAYWSRYKDALLADSELETLISVEMDWLRDNQPDAYKLLCRMGCYRYQDVKTVPFEGLICLLWDVSESQRVGIVNYLSKTSLIEVKGEYYLHPAIWELARSRLLEINIDWFKSNQQAAQFWTDSVETIETVDDALKAFESYHHYLAIKMYDKATDIIVYERKNKWVGKSTLGTSCYRLGLLSQLILALNILENKIGSSHQLVVVYDILAVAYRITGRIHDAISICNIALNIATKFKENSSTDKTNFERGEKLVAMCLFNIGICNMYLGNIESAIEWFEMVISSDINIDINCLNADSHLSQIIMSYFCLAYLYSLLDNQEKTHYFIRQSKDFTPVTEWSLEAV
ncbi:MAG: hypothetical protein WCP16_15625 [Pseudanabaena sp. ELA645]